RCAGGRTCSPTCGATPSTRPATCWTSTLDGYGPSSTRPASRRCGMLDTASPRIRRTIFWAWCAFAALNVVLMWLGPGLETVPFHLIWISLAIVYGLQAWRPRWAVSACVAVAVLTGLPLVSHAEDQVIPFEEVSEIPLMSLLFLVMVWHVRRR